MMQVIDRDSDPVSYWSRNNNIPVNLMQIIIKTVSEYNPYKMNLRNGDSDDIIFRNAKYGLCQLEGNIAIENGLECASYSNLTRLFDAATNLEYTCKYLRRLKEEHYSIPEEWEKVLMIAYPEHAAEILSEYRKYLKAEFDYMYKPRPFQIEPDLTAQSKPDSITQADLK